MQPLAECQKPHGSRAILTGIFDFKARRNSHLGTGSLFPDDGGTGRDPAIVGEFGEGHFAQTLPIGWIEKNQVELAKGARRAKRGSIAAQQLGDACDTKGLDVIANEAARLGPRIDKGNMAAPRESASSPRAPVPANRSSTRLPSNTGPSRDPRILNIDSRARSDVGRMLSSEGEDNCLPRNLPATMRMIG